MQWTRRSGRARRGRPAAVVPALCAVALAAGCATPDGAALEPTAIEGLRTWSYAERSPRFVGVGEAGWLEGRLAAVLEAGLASLGYRHVARHGDFVVDATVGVVERVERGSEAIAARTVWSHSYTPSYVIAGSLPYERRTRELRVRVRLLAGDGSELSSASDRRALEDAGDAPVADAVATLLAPLPRRTGALAVQRRPGSQ